MASSLHEEPLHHAEALDCRSRAVHFVFSKRESDTGVDMYKKFFPFWIIIACETFPKNHI